MKDDRRVHEMIADACLRAGSQAEFESDLGGYLRAQGLDEEDVRAILAAPPRLALYRRLVRNNLTGVTFKMMPRTRARLNALGAGQAREAHEARGAFDASFDAFLEEASPRTHYLRDVPAEFLAWVRPRWSRADVPPYAADLAAHELVEFAVAAAPVDATPPPLADVAIDRALVFSDAKRLVRYAFAVHLLPPEEDDRSEPAARPTSLLAYRDAEHTVRFLDLTPLAAAILERLFAGDTLGAALAAACSAEGVQLDDAILADTARLLSDLGERGVLLGARA